ncbi:SRPBCC domain-containing protein [Reinekea forsetii]|nr:SRPBCC domain-containing protein [Reinekea forsetii]
MTTLYHEISLVTSPSDVWAALTTRVGLLKWWPDDVSISGGDSWCLTHQATKSSIIIKVVEDIPDQALEWLCVQGPEEWVNTLIHWRLESRDDRQTLTLEHRDLQVTSQHAAGLNTFWGVTIDRLKHSLLSEVNPNDDVDLGLWT